MLRRLLAGVVVLWIAGLCGTAIAQQTVLVLEPRFEGEIAIGIEREFRNRLFELLGQGEHQVLTQEQARTRLGSEANRLLDCGLDEDCLREAGELTSATVGVKADITESGEIYTFTVDLFDLGDGTGLFFTDGDCALCTVDEAVDSFAALVVEARDAIPDQVAARAMTVRVETEPSGAEIWLDGIRLGVSPVEVEVEPGSHTVEARLGAGGVEQSFDLGADDGDQRIVLRLSDEPMVASPAYSSGVGAFDRVNTTAIGSVLLGTGLAALTAGVVMVVLDGDTTCTSGEVEDCAEVYDTLGGGVALSIFGTAALTTGTLMLLWDVIAGDAENMPPSTASFGVGFGLDQAHVLVDMPF